MLTNFCGGMLEPARTHIHMALVFMLDTRYGTIVNGEEE